MKHQQIISAFGYLKITLIKNLQEEFDITVNQNFAEMPYFIMKIENIYYGGLFTTSSLGFQFSLRTLMVGGSVLIFGILIYILFRKR